MVVMIERIIQLITFKEVIGSLMIFIAVLIVASIIWGNRTFSEDIKSNDFSFKSSYGWYR